MTPERGDKQSGGEGVAPGTQLGPYRIERLLGSGGMGEVYRARDSRLERDVAIKVIRSEGRGEDHLQRRLAREARAISALNHPHICNVYDINEQDGLIYLVMEYIEGKTLAAVLKEGLLPLDHALRYGTEIADATAAAHAKGIVHRDLKPGNVMIGASGVKVLDFGLAKRVAVEAVGASVNSDEATRTAALTETGQIIGTCAYMAPEQAEGKPADIRSDVFSLGIVLYEMFSGVRPFTGDGPLSTLAAVIRKIPKPLRDIRPQVPVRIAQIVSRCLEKAPENRYASAASVYRDLANFQAARTRPSGWRPALIGAAVVILIAVGALATRSYLHSSRTQWAENDALPRLEQLLSEHRLLAALPLSREASQYSPGSRALGAVSEVVMAEHEIIETVPPGADVFLADYGEIGDTNWQPLGPSPVRTDRIPYNGFYRLRARKEGFETLEATFSPIYRKSSKTTPSFVLHTAKETPAGMVWVLPAKAGSYGRQAALQKDVAGFWLDKYEVTNRQFKQFVDAGGYQKREFWTELVQNRRTISWDQAIALFTDATGKPGPAIWQLGTYLEGEADHPVSGVSWYEAAAYARFAGKSLPTVYHWYRAAGAGGLFSDILAFSNFGGRGAASVGANAGLSPFGSYTWLAM
jgi:serine/threonine protein kinase